MYLVGYLPYLILGGLAGWCKRDEDEVGERLSFIDKEKEKKRNVLL